MTSRSIAKMGCENALAFFLAAIAVGETLPAEADASGTPSVTIDNVVQRWPWNNKVDIAYTVTGGQNRSAGVYCGIRFAVTANGKTYSIAGSSIGASAESGEGSRQHRVTWTAPKGIVATDCSITATLFSTNVPSGNDYMIIDLTTSPYDIWYEGLMATQSESCARYRNDDCWCNRLVLRKIPRWADKDALPNADDLSALGGYPTGHSSSSNNSPTNWVTARDFYVGVYPVTQRQYVRIFGSNPAKLTGTGNGSPVNYRPVESVSWDDLRLSGTAPTSSIPAVASKTGTFFQRLNYMTGLYFDLPTEVMSEIATRAGATTTYFWNSDSITKDNVTCSENSNGTTHRVYQRQPNNWGFYDVAGDVYEWCLDDTSLSNLKNATDPFIPAFASGTSRRMRNGGSIWNPYTHGDFKASARTSNASDSRRDYIGFRVAYIPE